MSRNAILVLLSVLMVAVCIAENPQKSLLYENINANLEKIRARLQSYRAMERQCETVKQTMKMEIRALKALNSQRCKNGAKETMQQAITPSRSSPSYEECLVHFTPTTVKTKQDETIVEVQETTEKNIMQELTTPSSPRDRQCRNFTHPNLHLIPSQCGQSARPLNQPSDASSVGDRRRRKRVVNGNEAPLFALPWMARLRYKTASGRLEYRCGGSLVSRRYVLTAAMCVQELPSDVERLHSVILGEHTEVSAKECVEFEDGQMMCNEVPLTFGVESVASHPQYVAHTLANNVALIRLNEDVPSESLSVRPICLPLGVLPCKNLEGSSLIVSGWGRTEDVAFSPTLRWASVLAVNTRTCNLKLNDPRLSQRNFRVVLGPGQMCAGGKGPQDSCDGDGGGPLQMIAERFPGEEPRAVQFGIVSFGISNCGQQNLPSVYTRVSHYLPWILSTMQP